MSKMTRHYLPELKALGTGRKIPSNVGVNLTDRCNQRCIYCEIGQRKEPWEVDRLTYDDMIWILDEMARSGMRRISLCGGEPFLFNRLIDLVSYAGRHGIRCSVTTNGMTAHQLSDRELDVLRGNSSEINISVDSFREEILSVTRGTNAALGNVIRSIERFQDAGIEVTLLAAVSVYNYKELSHFTEEACRLGISQILFQPVIYASNYPERPALDRKHLLNVPPEGIPELMTELNKVHRFERTHPIRTNVYRIRPWIRSYLEYTSGLKKGWFFLKVMKKFYCREIYAIIDIAYDGGIQPCGLAEARITIHENRERGLLGLWQDATKQIREDLHHNRFYPVCNSCCHHFSRNMMASAAKYPFRNRKLLANLILMMSERILFRICKRISIIRSC